MEKDTHLINIYLKIHHKRTLTMDDLGYLAKYAPECFEKTCKNVVYNIPETKPIITPETIDSHTDESQPAVSAQPDIEKVLDNLKRLEAEDCPVADIRAEEVKSLLGNLYMELLFPHNDKDTFMSADGSERRARFDRRI